MAQERRRELNNLVTQRVIYPAEDYYKKYSRPLFVLYLVSDINYRSTQRLRVKILRVANQPGRVGVTAAIDKTWNEFIRDHFAP